MNTFKFFFEDVIGKYKTTDEVMYAILTNLDSALYQPGEAIIKHMAKVDELILIQQGHCHLYGYSKDKSSGMEQKVNFINLPRYSWYGDFQILLNLNSTFQMEAAGCNRSNNGKTKDEAYNAKHNYVQVYRLSAKFLHNICQQYPNFKRFLLLRATERRSRFHKVFEEQIQTNSLLEKYLQRKEANEMLNPLEANDEEEVK